MAEDRIGELAGGRERLVALAELLAEEVVHRGEHLGARPVVARQRQTLRRRLAPLAEHLDVGVPEAVDRLELVADEEDVARARPAAQQVDDVALQAVRVLELVDHDRAEPQLLGLADCVRCRAAGRVRGAAGPRSRAPTRAAFAAAYSVAKRSSSSCRSSLSRAASSSRAACCEPVARRAELRGAVARRPRARRSSSCSGFVPSASAAFAAATLLAPSRRDRRASAVRSGLQLGEALGDARAARRARAAGRDRPSGASRRRPSASCGAPARRRSRAAAAAPAPASAQNAASARSNASPRSTAAWSSASSWKRGSSPTANGCVRSSREQKPWMVEIQAPSSLRARS